MLNEKSNEPPLYIPACNNIVLNGGYSRKFGYNAPSSGVIVSVKFRRSAGSEKCVFIVDGRSNSVRSGIINQTHVNEENNGFMKFSLPFCTRICAALVLGFFFAAASSFFFIVHIYILSWALHFIKARSIVKPPWSWWLYMQVSKSENEVSCARSTGIRVCRC